MARKDIMKKKKGEVIYEAQIDGKDVNKTDNVKIILGVLLLGIALFSMLFL